ncbi:hypothetical protein PsYK624_045700 [Phanerochaete sordida]|uniref:Uncharacterized protein n=1 Tax=Phanerochaete sordida TaxID=48140 RepID=A0A9P3G5J4_9APHY|nr:hypothetical protein PsYK624_045700 [Phanerochaete sordida]
MPPRRQQQQQSQPQRAQRKYEPPAKRRMELVASVSRSSGLEKDGDALRDFKLQEEYRDFIQGKVDDCWKRYPSGRVPEDAKHRDEMRGNICILFRKLREAILATKRSDTFAVEVCETSMYSAILFSSPKDATSAISLLIPGLYKSQSRPPPTCPAAVTASLLYYLLVAYPSQSRYGEHLDYVPKGLIPDGIRQWLRDLTRALRQHSYSRLERLTERGAVETALGSASARPANEPKPGAPSDLALEALCGLLDSIRSRARDTTWTILRSAYRELSCPKPTDAPASTFTRDWLLRCLLLRRVAPNDDKKSDEQLLDDWLTERVSRAELRPKDGAEGRWIVCKLKT